MLSIELNLVSLDSSNAKFEWRGSGVPYLCAIYLDVASWKSLGRPASIKSDIEVLD